MNDNKNNVSQHNASNLTDEQRAYLLSLFINSFKEKIDAAENDRQKILKASKGKKVEIVFNKTT